MTPERSLAMAPAVSAYLAVTLDGFIARDDGAVDYLQRFQSGGDDYGYSAFIDTVDAVILGRGTYDVVLGFGVGPKPFGDRRLIVLTHRPLPDGGIAAETHAGALAPLLERLGAEGRRHVYLDGGATIRQGLREGVVDAMTLSVIPLVLGSGKPLFERGLPGSAWTLVEARGFPSGLAQLRYERAAG